MTATGLAGATALGGLVAAPVAAAEPAPLEVSLEASSKSLKAAGEYVALHTWVTDAAGAPVAGVEVTWHRQALDGGGWEVIKTSVTDGEGHTSYGTAPDRGYRYDVTIAATDEYAFSSPTSVTVAVETQEALRASIRATSTQVNPGDHIGIFVQVNEQDGPAAAGVPVTWYRRSLAGGPWEVVGHSSTDGTGLTSLGQSVAAPGYAYDAISTATSRYASVSPVSVDVRASDRAQQLIDIAYRYAGTPYRWGGTSPGGFDCSGFTGYVYRQLGINLPRTSRDQRAATQNIPRGQQRPGDLIFIHDSSGRVYHVSIYVGGGKTFGATRTGDVVRHSAPYGNWSVGRVQGL